MKTDESDGTTLSRLICLMKESFNSAGLYLTIRGVEFVNRKIFEAARENMS
jgi:hypothetical protein